MPKWYFCKIFHTKEFAAKAFNAPKYFTRTIKSVSIPMQSVSSKTLLGEMLYDIHTCRSVVKLGCFLKDNRKMSIIAINE